MLGVTVIIVSLSTTIDKEKETIMKFKTSRITPPRRLVLQVVNHILGDSSGSLEVIVPSPRSLNSILDQKIKVEVIPEEFSEKFRFEAKYQPTNSILYVNLSLLEFNYEGRELKQALYKVVSHELVHVYQILYTRIKEKAEILAANH